MLRKRLLSGGGFTLLLLLAFLLPVSIGGALLTLIFAVLAAMGSVEFLGLTKRMGTPGYPGLVAVLGVVLMLGIGGSGIFDISLWSPVVDEGGILVFLIGTGVALLHHPQFFSQTLNRMFVSMFGFLFVAWCLSFVLRLFFIQNPDINGPFLALLVLAVTKFADIGAYSVGTFTAKGTYGNHKLAPSVSPKKSWEGLTGGMVTAILVGLLLVSIGHEVLGIEQGAVIGYGTMIGFGVFAAVFGLIGDLIVSACKRAAKAEDSGCIPGMGGALDVVDSLLLVAPLFYLCIQATI